MEQYMCILLKVIDKNYCNNLATRVIPFFTVSKSSVGKTIWKTVLPKTFRNSRVTKSSYETELRKMKSDFDLQFLLNWKNFYRNSSFELLT